MVDSSNSVVQELSNKIKELISDTSTDITIINDVNEAIDDGIYIIDLPIFMKGKVSFINNSNQAVFNPPNDENVDIQIDWGDGTIDKGTQKSYAHTYADNTKSYNVIIKGDINTIQPALFPLGFEEIELKKPINLVSATFAQNGGMVVLKKLILPYGINQLPSGCFAGCTSLTSIDIPNSVTIFNESCFSGCTSLTSIDIPNTVTSFGSSCFAGCTGLTNVIIPSSVTSIGGDCFRSCTGLTSVNIPSSVTSIGNGCFRGDDNLINYELNWEDFSAIIPYASTTMQNNTNTIFTIPTGQTSNYVEKRYPSDKLVERDE